MFLLSKTQNYIILLSLYQQKATKNYQNFLANGLKDQCIGMNIKKSENKNATNKYIYFFESNFSGVNQLFVLVYLNQTNDIKRYNTLSYCILIKKYNIINWKNVYDKPTDFDIKQYGEIRKLITGQGEDTSKVIIN